MKAFDRGFFSFVVVYNLFRVYVEIIIILIERRRRKIRKKKRVEKQFDVTVERGENSRL